MSSKNQASESDFGNALRAAVTSSQRFFSNIWPSDQSINAPFFLEQMLVKEVSVHLNGQSESVHLHAGLSAILYRTGLGGISRRGALT